RGEAADVLAHALPDPSPSRFRLFLRVPIACAPGPAADRPTRPYAAPSLFSGRGLVSWIALEGVQGLSEPVLAGRLGRAAAAPLLARLRGGVARRARLRQRDPARRLVGALHVVRPRGSDLVRLRLGDTATRNWVPCDLPLPADRPPPVPQPRPAHRR